VETVRVILGAKPENQLEAQSAKREEGAFSSYFVL
jgi:hypothetical protein